MLVTRSRPRLYIIYNAPGGWLNAVRDSFHKTLSPSTYACALCALAFGFFTMKPAWRRFLSRIPFPIEELHKDDYRAVLPDCSETLPVILLHEADGTRKVIAAAREMEAMDDLDALIALAERRLEVRAG